MDKLNEVVATRILEVVNEHGQPVETVNVSLGRPQQEPDAIEWGCAYQIDGLGYDRPYRTLGIDGLQAMAGALLVIGGSLQGEDEVQAGRVRWAGRSYFRDAFLRVHFAPEDGAPGELGAILATTTYDQVKSFGGHKGPMTITLGYPRQAPSGVWFCPYRVAGLGVDCVRWVSGFDSMHAVQSAVLVIHGIEDYAAELFQRHERSVGSDILGFPMIPDEPESSES